MLSQHGNDQRGNAQNGDKAMAKARNRMKEALDITSQYFNDGLITRQERDERVKRIMVAYHWQLDMVRVNRA